MIAKAAVSELIFSFGMAGFQVVLRSYPIRINRSPLQ
ncbi:hypothetical protein SAMN05421820_101615 [Pedobacter steynii]|uniref:Uncharacterized protein n=1 Tax=Pedobacter steynii TaxID=430522 RepID=A0A1G9KM26_9SPHI|nr:hypothetical protein SAMN05421820_101615 [Pedobacter steynii]